MITIEAYRARVGCFCSIARKGKEKVPKSQNCFEGGSFYWPDFLLTFFMFICIMTLVLNINMALLKLSLLQIHGDVESNPGPTYKIQKTVSASFHQAHMKFGNSAGTQCSCNALFAICFSIIKKVSIWKSWLLRSQRGGVLLKFGIFFPQFQPRVAYKNVTCKKKECNSKGTSSC